MEIVMEHSSSSTAADPHPFVGIAMVGLVVMFVGAVWTFFDADAYGAWLDVIVSGLFFIAVAIPALLWLTWRRNTNGPEANEYRSLRDWVTGDFETWTGRINGTAATAEILLPIAAGAVGMTLLGLVFHIVARTAG
jgi:hypothetical protein